MRSLRPPLVPVVLLVLLILAAVLAPVIAPHDPTHQDVMNRLAPPVWQGGTWSFPLGTDPLGRGVLSNILYGLRISLVTGFLAVAISSVAGVAIGLTAGYRNGGWYEAAAMRLADIQLSLPAVLVALAMLAVFGRGLTKVILVIGVVGWARYARLARSIVLGERQKDYVSASVMLGARTRRTLLRHILPNILNPLLVQIAVDIPRAIELEATLSFLGLGVAVTTPSLGLRVAQGYQYLFSGAWWTSVLPGLMLVLLVLIINLLGDWVRDALDPRFRVHQRARRAPS